MKLACVLLNFALVLTSKSVEKSPPIVILSEAKDLEVTEILRFAQDDGRQHTQFLDRLSGGALAKEMVMVTQGHAGAVDARKPPSRIVSASLASDEVVFELLQRSVQLSRLVAVSSLADDPRYSNIAPVPASLKGRFGGELESVLALKPDLLIAASTNKPETLQRLRDAQVPSFIASDFVALEDIAKNIRAMGRLLHLDGTAEQLATELEEGLATVAKSHHLLTPKPTVLEFTPGDTLAGSGTLFDAIALAAGAENLAATKGLKGWPRIGAETLTGMRPTAIVAGGLSGDVAERDAILALLRASPGWRDMPAVREGRVIVIRSSELGAVSHHVLKAVIALNTALKALPDAKGTPAP